MVINTVGKQAGQSYREYWGDGRGFEILNREVRRGLTVKVVFEGDLKKATDSTMLLKGRKVFQAEAKTTPKVLMQEPPYLRNSKKPV